MSNSATEIANLLYRYAELMDGGELEAVAEMFRHARMKSRSAGELLDNAGMLEQWRRFVKIYPCGTPRTKHVVTNPIIEVDEAQQVLVLKRSMSAGFAGIDNDLFYNEKTAMVFGDAKGTVQDIVTELGNL